ncbi:nuclear pore complex associated protein [Schizosaccharomyces japonicus yFS275]|uniref:Nuclear pore complex associated protein n=1 Tax=Schizosaccharomyces japonicus (strain yFS275 / FY16936) TaxID=402676 RepID=B6K7D7_SCHJY|nr:nuclear pore complex associated protein [Schizosaccharomyces japonicus yFS275]EEB09441.1 nuclear pore complex associated protein [Schizosaccharomyces japonicus yFS275]
MSANETDISAVCVFLDLSTDYLRSLLKNDDFSTFFHSVLKKSKEYATLKEESLVNSVNNEQQVSSLRKQVVQVTKERDEAKQRVSSLDTEIEDIKTKSNRTLDELRHKNSELDVMRNSLEQTNKNLESIQASQTNLLNELTLKNNELQLERETVSRLQEKSLGYHKAIEELKSEKLSFEAIHADDELQLKLLSQKQELLIKNNNQLISELNSANENATALLKQVSAEKAELLKEVTEEKSKFETLKRHRDELVLRCNSLSSRSEALSLEYSELKKKHDFQQSSNTQELQHQVKLNTILSERNTELQKRVEELEESYSSTNNLFGETQANWESQEEKFQLEISRLKNEVDSLNKELSSLQQQLGLANKRLEAVSASDVEPESVGYMSPSAKALIMTKKSNLSISQLYYERLSLLQKLEESKHQNEKLQASLNELIEEIDNHAPTLKEKMDKISAQNEAIVKLSKKCQSIEEERDDLRSQLNDILSKRRDLQQENDHYQRQIQDLALQVRVLLQEVDLDSSGLLLSQTQRQYLREILQGKLRRNENDTNQLITDRLTVFHNITELQEQNQKLLNASRRLADQLEEQESATENRSKEEQNELISQADKTIDELMNRINLLNDQLSCCSQERDMFRELLHSAKENDVHLTHNYAEAFKAAVLVEKTQVELQHFKTAYHTLKVSTEKQNKINNDLIDKLRVQNANYSSNVTLLEARCSEFSNSLSDLESMLSRLTDEKNSLHNECVALRESVAKLNAALQSTEGELTLSREAVQRLERLREQHVEETALHTLTESQFRTENGNLRGQISSLNSSLANVRGELKNVTENAQLSYEKAEARISQLCEELRRAHLQISSQSEDIKRLSLQRTFELENQQQKLEALYKEISQLQQNNACCQAEKRDLEGKINDYCRRLEKSEAEYNSFRNKFFETTSFGNGGELLKSETTSLKQEVAEKTVLLKELRERLMVSQQRVGTANEALKSMNETHDMFKEALQKELQKKDASLVELNEKLSRADDSIKALQQSLTSSSTRYNQQLQQINENLSQEKLRSQELSSLHDESKKALEALQNDLAQQIRLYEVAQSDYENEVVKHAATAETLHKLRQQYHELQTKFNEVSEERNNSKIDVLNLKASWEAQRTQLEDELTGLRRTNDDLQLQNKIVHSQLESLTLNLDNLSARAATTVDMSTKTESDSTVELHEVIRYLRQEKEIAHNKLELIRIENKRIHQEHTRLENEIAEKNTKIKALEQELADTEKISQSKVDSDDYKLLIESNSLLRDEKQESDERIKMLESSIKELETRLEQLQEELVNLKSELSSKTECVKLLTEDNERWKERNSKILKGYERVDPSTIDELKQNLEKAEKEKTSLEQQLKTATDNLKTHTNTISELKTENTSLKQEVEQLNIKNTNVAAAWKNTYDQLVSTSQAKVAQLRQKLNVKIQECESKRKEIEQLHKRVEAFDNLNTEEQHDKLQTQISELEKQRDSLASELQTLKQASKSQNSSNDIVGENNAEMNELRSSNEKLQSRLSEAQSALTALQAEYAKLKDSSPEHKAGEQNLIRNLQSEIERLKSKMEGSPATQGDHSGHISEENEVERVREEAKIEFEEQLRASNNTISELQIQIQQLQNQLANSGASSTSENANALDTVDKTQLEQSIAEAVAMKEKELKEQTTKLIEATRKEAEMRNKLKISISEKQVHNLKTKTAELEHKVKELTDRLSKQNNHKEQSLSGSTETTKAPQKTKRPAEAQQSAQSQKKMAITRPTLSRPVPMKPETGKISISGASKRTVPNASSQKNKGNSTLSAKSSQTKRQRDDTGTSSQGSKEKKTK